MNSSIDWEDILENIKNRKCILFLGPKAYQDDERITLESKVFKDLGISDLSNPYLRAYYEDGFFLFKEKRFRRKVIKQLNNLYHKFSESYKNTLQKLAQIPFPIYVSTTPDNLLFEEFYDLNIPCFHSFYNMGKTPEPYLPPYQDVPLIYNMFGFLERNESMVLTHNDFFEYFKSIFIGKSMPDKLKDELFNAEQYIFLGLPYDKWYLQLLLRILSLHTSDLEHLEKIAIQPNQFFPGELYQEQFKIEFIPEEVNLFIGYLFDLCERENILRTPSKDSFPIQNLTFEEVENAIASGKEYEAMDMLMFIIEVFHPKTDGLKNELLLIKSDYNNIQENFLKGLEDSNMNRMNRNKAIATLLSLNDKVKDLII